jgi:hypothetical protein
MGVACSRRPFHVLHVRATRLELANFVRRIEPLTEWFTARLHTFHLAYLKPLRTLLLTSFLFYFVLLEGQ